MPTLTEQMNDVPPTIPKLLFDILEALQIEERGGGPEGLYYTHQQIEGEFLLRNTPQLVKLLCQPK